MPSAFQILKMRRHRRKKTSRRPYFRLGLGSATLISISAVVFIIGITAIFMSLSRDLPSLETIPLLLEPPDGLMLQPTRFYDRSGEHVIYTLQNPAIKERNYIPIQGGDNSYTNSFLSPNLITSTIAIADPTFWSNSGFSTQGVRENEHKTIAQKLVTDLLLWKDEPTLQRALQERLLAAQITRHYGREKVMEWYLNSAYFGNLAYGAEAAAQIYFGKSAASLNLAEAAVLAAVAEAPSLNPLDAPKSAIERQGIVIDAMIGQGLVSEEQADQAKNTEIVIINQSEVDLDLAPAYIDYVWDQLTKIIPRERLERGGFEITTTLDYDLQIQVSCTTLVHLSRITSQNLEFLTQGENQCDASLLLPTFTIEETPVLDDLNANVIVLDPSTGQILAMVGGPNPGLVPAYQARHPSGTLITPIIYLTGFTRGFGPASLVWDIPLELTKTSPSVLTPNGQFQGPIRLRSALANDYLTPALQITNQIGTENILQISYQLGLNSLMIAPPNPSEAGCSGCPLILGEGGITLVEAVQAYSTFTNQGMLVGRPSERIAETGLPKLQPISILNIRDLNGNVQIHGPNIETRPVISPQLAYLMIDVLSDEAARWPSLSHPNPLEIGRPAGAKMGKTLQQKDAWTVGFTPQLVVGVWMGYENHDPPTEGKIPPKFAAALWHAIIQYATQDFPSFDWQMPPGISQVEVCDPSGMLPTTQCPTVVSEVFLMGREPTQPDTLYKSYQINRETDRLATIFTPPELIEERTYINIPTEANLWAQSAELPLPPETYDVIYLPVALTNTQITSPQMFAQLNGKVTIRGSAFGDDFESYRMQVGQGINPSGWIVIKGNSTQPVDNGVLGEWDTTGYEGLHALQLVILRRDDRVETATIQVTIDNLPPDISATYPEDGQELSFETNRYITLQGQISDNLDIDLVEFFIDDELVTTQSQAPFAIPWRSAPGDYAFRIVAADLAGNVSEVEVIFRVE